jgi:hypothetical protein
MANMRVGFQDQDVTNYNSNGKFVKTIEYFKKYIEDSIKLNHI